MANFEWDEAKRAINLAKHGVDFELAKRIFDWPVLEGADNRQDYGEPRIGAYGLAGEVVLFVVYTWRGEHRRLISARYVGTDERRVYYAHLAEVGEDDDR